MTYKEEKINLFSFSVDEQYYFAQCISADFGMGAGIAVQFNKYFNMKSILCSKYGDYLQEWLSRAENDRGDCILEGKVFNLITKKNYWNKPTYKSLENALLSMKEECLTYGIKKVAMPKIGCGLDKLEWSRVSAMIKDLFSDTDMDFIICYQ